MIPFVEKQILEQAKPIYSDKKLISGCLGAEGNRNSLGRGRRELSGVMEMYYILIVIMVTQVHTVCQKLPKWCV